jgi:flagellar motor switch protein FliN/FliY
MADEKNEGAGEMSEDEKLAAEWEAAMEEAGDSAEGGDDDWGEALAEQEAAERKGGKGAAKGNTTVKNAPMEEFEEGAPAHDSSHPDLDVILDIPVTISMEVGNTSIPIRNLLQLNQGSVIELDRLAGEPLDVLVNGMLIAHGEVVMVNEKFGIRLTDVISPSERIRKLTK